MRVSCVIMAHPRRKAWVEELVDQLGQDVPISWDPFGPSKRPQQRWENAKRAWQMADPESDYTCLLQDDALVCNDFLSGLEKALDQLGPVGLMSPYTGRGRPNQKAVRAAIARADTDGDSWLATWSLNWGVAIVAPTATIGDMLAWCDRPTMRGANTDYRIGVYYRDILGWCCWYTHPSLVEHRDGPSLIGHGSGGDRVAHRFHSGSALDVDWSATPNGEPLNPYITAELRELAVQPTRVLSRQRKPTTPVG